MLSKIQLESAFLGEVEKVEINIFYKGALLLVSLAMVILPLIYLCIVFFAAYGVVFFAQDPFGVLQSDAGILSLFVQYCGPVVISSIIFLFMIKPFFVRLVKPAEGVIITREQEPVLFDFIEMVCSKVNAPYPKQVLLNADANAAAGFKSGIGSFLKGDLRLIIGLPLVSTMTVSQLGGILAHEFGHFSQGAGMRLSYLVRVISSWFSRVVFERDKWDQKIEDWSSNTHLAIALILGLARLGVWLSRKVLYLLMLLGNLISSIMLRQMEFDADRYEIRFGGSQQFIETTKKLKLVTINWMFMYQGIFENWSNKKLNNNIAGYLSHRIERTDDNLKAQIEKEINGSTTGFFDTHPSDKDRIESAKKENMEGVFKLAASAQDLFQNFDKYSLKTSVLFYMNLLNDDYKDEYLIDLEEFLEKDKVIEANDRALMEFFKGAISAHFPINFSKQPEAEPRPDPIKELESISEFLGRNSEKLNEVVSSKYKLLDDLSLWKPAELIVSKGNKVIAKEFNLESGKPKEIDARLNDASKIEMDLNFENEVFRRKLARIPVILEELTEGTKLNAEVIALKESEIKFAQYYSSLRKIMDLYSQFIIIAVNGSTLKGNKKIDMAFEDIIFKLEREFKSAYEHFLKAESPFETGVNFGDLLFPEGVSNLQRDKLVDIYQTFYQVYILNYCRIVGQLGVIALTYLNNEVPENQGTH